MNINFDNYQKIIIAPLNWGLGHATRCIPIIDHLLDLGKEVLIASDGISLALLRKEYPNLKFYELPSYNVNYKGTNFFRSLLKQTPKILNAIRKERMAIIKLLESFKADLVISDNRYGLKKLGIRSTIITHQTQPHFKNPIIKWTCAKLVERLLDGFDEIWVPDHESHILSGDLSKGSYANLKFIGPLTRLKYSNPQTSETKYDVGIILSGPEPSRSILEKKLYDVLSSNVKTCLIRGTNTKSNLALKSKFYKLIDLANTKEVNQTIEDSKIIICRSGYSSIMDLYKANKPSILIPTPGQTEQEYLADYLEGKYGFNNIAEGNLSVELNDLIRANI